MSFKPEVQQAVSEAIKAFPKLDLEIYPLDVRTELARAHLHGEVAAPLSAEVRSDMAVALAWFACRIEQGLPTAVTIR